MDRKNEEKLTFEEHDQFHRDRYANFLIDLAQHAKGQEGSYTIAVNAPYGSGKTTLLKMMVSKIKTDYSTMDKPLIAVYYNAWQYDYFNEPLVPLTMSLFEDEALAEASDYRKSISRLACASRFVASLANDVIVSVTGLNFKEAYKATKQSGIEDDFFEYKQAIDELRDALKDAVELYGTKGRMLVIIDELDRCRPDFAIKTLEITKHLLTNEKIVFLYALDMGQLQKAVEKAYGSGMDSSGYLLRFFDYITTIPEPNINTYLKKKVEEIEERRYVDGVTMELEKCYKNFNMTLRDVDRIMAAYTQMHRHFVKNYNNIVAHMLYIHLLCLKYKRRNWFESITCGNREVEDGFVEFYKKLRDGSESISYRIQKLAESKEKPTLMNENKQLNINGGIHYEMVTNNKGTLNDVSIGKEIGDRNERIMLVYLSDGGTMRSAIRLQDIDVLGYVLFPEDITRFKQIKARYIPEYIHQHMEFFDFETGLVETGEVKKEASR